MTMVDQLSQWGLRYRFDAARAAAGVDFQFRDIRAKAATDTGDPTRTTFHTRSAFWAIRPAQ